MPPDDNFRETGNKPYGTCEAVMNGSFIGYLDIKASTLLKDRYKVSRMQLQHSQVVISSSINYYKLYLSYWMPFKVTDVIIIWNVKETQKYSFHLSKAL